MRLMPEFGCTYFGGRVAEVPEMPRNLLMLVALERGPVIRSRVAAGLWPDSSEEQALRRLRNLVWRVNQIIPETPLISAFQGRLDLAEGVSVPDWGAAMDLVEPLLRRSREGSGSGSVWDLRESWSLLKLDLLASESSEVVQEVRREWNYRRFFALDHISRTLLDAGDPVPAMDLAAEAMRIDPLSEAPHRTLTIACLHRHENATALRIFHQYSDLLSKEIGVSPSVEYKGIVQSITRSRSDTRSKPRYTDAFHG